LELNGQCISGINKRVIKCLDSWLLTLGSIIGYLLSVISYLSEWKC